MTKPNHDPYWPSVTIVKDGRQPIYNWNTLAWEPVTSSTELCGLEPPNFPVPAIDYYNSPNPDHFLIGHLMEWSIPLEIQTRFRCTDWTSEKPL